MLIIRSPLRISIGGGGTDIPSYYKEKGSFFISAAINKYVYVTITKPFVKGIYLSKDVDANNEITDDMLVMRRPATNLNADMYDFVLGKQINKPMKKGDALQVNDLILV